MSQFLFHTEKIEDNRTGIPHLISNIEVCESIGNLLSTTLGPYGLDKLFYGKQLILTNDGATIMSNMNYKHPIGRMLASLSQSQDKEVGDGTTSVVILTAEILSSLKSLILENYCIENIKKILKNIRLKCIERIEELKVEYTTDALVKLAETCLNSKSIRNDKKYFAEILIEGLKSGEDLNIAKIPGGSQRDSFLVNGIAFEKTFTYAGYEQQPKMIINPKICCLNVELEWKSERENAEIRVSSVEEFQNVVDAEWKIIKDKLDDIINSGANVVLSSLPIGDYATQYFASKNVFSAGRVKCLNQITAAFGGKISNTTKFLQLSSCDLFEERQIGNLRFNYLEGKSSKKYTLVLRGPGSEALEEVERAVHDAICVLKIAMKQKNIVTGGGSVEMDLSKLCRKLALESKDESLFIYKAISKAFEKIPVQLAENFGLDSISVIQKLRRAHSSSSSFGISINGVEDMQAVGVFEPLEVKKNMVNAAFNVAHAILMINSTILSRK